MDSTNISNTCNTTNNITSESENDERKNYLLGQLKKGCQITSREREELMFKYKINDLSLFRPTQSPSSPLSTIINLDTTTTQLSNLEIKNTFNENSNTNKIILKKYQYREIDESTITTKVIINKYIDTNNTSINTDGDNNNNNNTLEEEREGEIDLQQDESKIKHDYVCENCKWCDGFVSELPLVEQCTNCKCSLIHHISSTEHDDDSEQDEYDNNNDDQDDYNNNNSDYYEEEQ